MEKVQNPCCRSKLSPLKKMARTSNGVSFFSTLLIILLPKCPLCIAAYMGAILLFFDIDYSELAPVLLHAKPVLGVLITTMIALNYKGKKTIISVSISTIAVAAIILENYYYIALFPVWIVYFALFFAIWYNGNFGYFVRFVRSKLSTA